MSTTTHRPLNEYVQAFAQYAPGGSRVFYTKSFGRHALINDSVNIYQVSHFSDLTAEYESFFSADFGMLYTEFPADLWDILLKKILTINADDLIIEIFQAWSLYWERQETLFDSKHKFEQAKQVSYTDFQQLVEIIHTVPDDLVKKAGDLDDVNLLPVIALTIRQLYSSMLDFYKDCVRVMAAVFYDQIGDGEFFIRVGSDQIPMPEDQTFFIYTVDVDF